MIYVMIPSESSRLAAQGRAYIGAIQQDAG